MGHFLGMNSRVHPNYKTKYRVNNGSEYDRALVQRGEITLWMSDDTIEDWKPDRMDLSEQLQGSTAGLSPGVLGIEFVAASPELICAEMKTI